MVFHNIAGVSQMYFWYQYIYTSNDVDTMGENIPI